MKRLLIYLTYDKQNIIDDYVGYFLHSLRAVADSIAVVCNMQSVEKGLHNLSDYADCIFYRSNVGLDAGGFKDALCTFIGWDKVKQYDEIILANDSFYGPFDDISRIFLEMENRGLDFWGLMKRGAGEYGTIGKDPEHILSFFYVFQAPLIHSRDFCDYWKNMPYYQDYMTAVKQYERQLTRHFADLGYTYDTYADTLPNEAANLKNQFFQCDYLSYEMIVKRKFPFLKKKQMSNNTLHCQTQENPALSMEYIEKHTAYDVNLIWNNLIRTQNPAKLQRTLGLQFILQGHSGNRKKHTDVIVLVRVQWLNAADTVCEYLERIRDICDIRVIAWETEIASGYISKGLTVLTSKASDLEILQQAYMEKYGYICLLHDSDLSSEQLPSCSGKSYFYNIWENLIKDENYMEEVVHLLETKKHIGMLMHPMPIFGTWIGEIGFPWADKYTQIKEWLVRLDLNAVTDADIPPVNVTNNFWIKADVIASFIQKQKALPYGNGIPESICNYLWTYIVQDSGKLTGIVESAFYASMNETNYHYYLQTFLCWFTERYGPHQKLHEFKELFFVNLAAEECRRKYKKWYVYGTGEIAERCFEWVKDTSAFIVSDGQPKAKEFHGRPIIYLSELQSADSIGIILCLSKENQERVIEVLKKRKINNYFTINREDRM